MLRFIKEALILILVIGLMGVMGCGEDENFSPTIFLFKAEPHIVGKGEQVKIRLSAGDVDKDLLTYTWSKDGGAFIGTADEFGITWIAPEEEGIYNITVKVSDGVYETSETVKILVWRSGDYYPLFVGNKWVYIDQNENEITFEMIDTIEIQGTDVKESFVTQISNSDPELPENFVNYSYVGRSKDGFGIDQHAASIQPGSMDTMKFVPWLPLYKFPLVPGDSWEVEYIAALPPEGYPIGGGTAKYEVIAEETVTVPAGTFENAFHIRETFTWELEDDKLDETVSDKWLAPNVGIVKVEQAQKRVGETLESKLELKHFEVKLK